MGCVLLLYILYKGSYTARGCCHVQVDIYFIHKDGQITTSKESSLLHGVKVWEM